MRRLVSILVQVCAVISLIGAAPSLAARDLTTVQVNLNQVGYLPADAKVALVETNRKLAKTGGFARVLALPAMTAALPDIPLSVDRRRYGKYRHQYEVDFSALTTPGTYAIEIEDDTGLLATSPPTAIGASAFNGLIPLLTRYFTEQRCGDNAPLIHGVCHTDDGVAVGGPRDGMAVDLTGGWHDAGDYVKFAATTSYVTYMLLFAIRELAPASMPAALRTQVRDEARKGIEWLLRLHPSASEFYFQVADERDHNAPTLRLPENDTVYGGPRPGYYGLGANLAGRVAAALALCSQEWQSDDPTFASRCLSEAQEIYAMGKTIVDGTATDPKFKPIVTCVRNPSEYAANRLNCDFYQEDSYLDDMALGAVSLYKATSTGGYLTDACSYANSAQSAYGPLVWLSVHDLELYELYPYGASCSGGQAQLLSYLKVDVDRLQRNSARDKYGFAERRYGWGSLVEGAGDGITCVLYQKLTGDLSCGVTARTQLDYILGRNPFGVSFIAGAGTTYPLNPHGDVPRLLHSEWYQPGSIIGSVAGGPAKRRAYPFRSDPDLKAAVKGDTSSPYAKFQTGRFQYHDIPEDYVSNEPAIDYDANVLALVMAYAGP